MGAYHTKFDIFIIWQYFTLGGAYSRGRLIDSNGVFTVSPRLGL